MVYGLITLWRVGSLVVSRSQIQPTAILTNLSNGVKDGQR